jgi:hypothetical protein
LSKERREKAMDFSILVMIVSLNPSSRRRV